MLHNINIRYVIGCGVQLDSKIITTIEPDAKEDENDEVEMGFKTLKQC